MVGVRVMGPERVKIGYVCKCHDRLASWGHSERSFRLGLGTSARITMELACLYSPRVTDSGTTRVYALVWDSAFMSEGWVEGVS